MLILLGPGRYDEQLNNLGQVVGDFQVTLNLDVFWWDDEAYKYTHYPTGVDSAKWVSSPKNHWRFPE